MRIVPLKIVPIISNETVAKQGFSLDYRQEFLGLVERFLQGITIIEMIRYQRLNQALRAAEGKSEVILEDTDYELLQQRMKTASFNFYADEVVQMAADLMDAPTVSVNDLTTAAIA